MKVFLKKIFLFLFPLFIIYALVILGYFILDPFRILYKQQDYSYTPFLNRNFQSTEAFLNNYPEYKYNSFIFGSSRAMAYNPDSWKQYLDQNAQPFCFNCYSEYMYDIHLKIKFLDSIGINIDNAIISIDPEEYFFHTKKIDRQSILFLNHPALENEDIKQYLLFHMQYFKVYLNLNFFLSYYSDKFLHIDNDFTHKHLDKSKLVIHPDNNWMIRPDLDEMIARDKNYHNNPSLFTKREKIPLIHPQVILQDEHSLLKEIKRIFDKHQTDYKIIINPMYNYNSFDSKDISILKDIFGKENIYDFSGKNTITRDKTNYYESSHFRPHVGDSILKFIYQNNK